MHLFTLQSHLAGSWSFHFSVVEWLADALGYNKYLLKHVLQFFQAWVSSSRLQLTVQDTGASEVISILRLAQAEQ